MGMENMRHDAWETIYDDACIAHRTLNYKQAEHLYSVALAVAINLSLETEIIANLFYQLGRLYMDQNSWRKAELALSEALNILETGKNSCEIDKAMVLIQLSESLRHQNKYRQSAQASGDAQRLILKSQVHLENCFHQACEGSINRSGNKKKTLAMLAEIKTKLKNHLQAYFRLKLK